MENKLKILKIIFLIIFVLLIALVIKYELKKKNEIIENNNQNVALNHITQTEDFSDNAIFADGSVPSTWETAGITDPIAFKKFLITLQSAILNHDKETVISSLDKKIGTKEYILKNYNTIFNQKVEDAFKTMNIHEIFRNYQGAMIGNGTVWFEQNKDGTFSVLAINN